MNDLLLHWFITEYDWNELKIVQFGKRYIWKLNRIEWIN